LRGVTAGSIIHMSEIKGTQGMELAGKVALVTGGARRIGAAVSRALASAGADVAVHYHRSAAEAADLAAALRRDFGVSAWTVGRDLSVPGAGGALFDDVLAATGGRLDLVVNSASAYAREAVAAGEPPAPEALARALRLHVEAPEALLRRLAARVSAEGTGCAAAVNILDARIAGGEDPVHPAYLEAKRRLAARSRALALELAPRLRLNCVAPGAVLEPDGEGRDALLRLAAYNPMGAVGSPEGLADCVLFLLRQDFVAGQVLYYDGGRHLRW